jgi:hypothetical protein
LCIYQIISACAVATIADRTYRRRLSLLLPKIERQQKLGKEAVFRADAAFAKPELYQALEERDVKYAIRLPANDHPQRKITELLTRPVGTPSPKPVVRFKSFLYQAASWWPARRVMAKMTAAWQSATNFGDEIRSKGCKCLITRSENAGFRCLCQREQSWSIAA